MKVFLSIFFCAVLAAVLPGCGKKNGASDAEKIPVRLEKPAPFLFADQTATQGVIEPVDHATLAALIPGRLEELKVREGDRVKKGELLFRSDRKNLENRCILAGEALKMAQERLRTREADLELAKVNFDKAQLDYNRGKTLYSTHSVSQDSYESAELKFRAGQLAIRQAQASVATAKAEVSFAQATLEIARKRLADSMVTAPYDGVISAKLRQENEFCNAGTPVLKIERPGSKRMAAVLSAVHYPRFAAGKTMARISFLSKEFCRVPVTVVVPAIDRASRTMEVKADLPPSLTLPSGMLCDVDFIFGERKSLSLPEEAVLFRPQGKFAVFTEDKGVARELPLIPGLTQGGRTEIRNAEVLKEKSIIVSGQYFVSDGTPVSAGEK